MKTTPEFDIMAATCHESTKPKFVEFILNIFSQTTNFVENESACNIVK